MTDDTPETIDTSTEAVEQMAAAFAGRDADLPPARVVDATLRALAAERGTAVAAYRGLANITDAAIARAKAAEARASEHGAYRTAAAAFLASKGLLGEFDTWCEARGLDADAVGRLMEVARAVDGVRNRRSTGAGAFPYDPGHQWGRVNAALDALPPGILDQSTEN